MPTKPTVSGSGSGSPWSTVAQQAITAAQKVLGQNWGAVSSGAAIQIENLANTARYIAENRDKMTPLEREHVVKQQADSLEAVLLIYKMIDIALAEAAVKAVWDSIGGVLKTVAGIAIKIR